jgi:outer membrane immunogenic protein
MRRWFFLLLLIVLPSGVDAADYGVPALRGPFVPQAPYYGRWAGFYGGGQVGYGATRMDFGKAFDTVNIFDPSNPFTAPLGSVSTWATFGTDHPAAISYGGFVGYNSQWGDAVLGVEVNYNHTSLRGQSSASQCYSDTDPLCLTEITLGDNNDYNVTVNATASARITDYATFRARGGWAAGNFMPYAMIGLAVGRVEIARTATATGALVGGGGDFVAVESSGGTRYPWGYSAGVGIDVLLLPNVFVRAEYEYVTLRSVMSMDLAINAGRIGAGVKF